MPETTASPSPTHADPNTYDPPALTSSLTDSGNVDRLIARHGQDLRYCREIGRWLIWDGRRWAEDHLGRIECLALDTVRAIAWAGIEHPDPAASRALQKWAMRSESAPRLREMVYLAQSRPEVVVAQRDLDRDLWLLNLENGTLDLRNLSVHRHRREDLLTKIAGARAERGAACPQWMAFLQHILRGDEELIAFLRRAVGYSLTGVTHEQALFLCYGTGANGKSTLLEVLRALLGDYARQMGFDTLLEREGRGVPNDLARLKGARFVTAAEADEGRRLAESVVKQLTGGDTITARFLHREFFEFTPEFKLFLATNHRPRVRGTDHALWRRIRLIPFEVTIPEEEQDRDLKEKLMEELPGILSWALRGLVEWKEQGLGEAPKVRRATAEYREEEDDLASFFADCCELGPEASALAKDLFAAYSVWAERNKERPMSSTRFGRALRERGFQPGCTTSGGARGRRVWRGLAIVPAVEC